MSTVTIELTPAPSTPLNLQFGVVYSPRVPTPPFVGFGVCEIEPNVFDVSSYDAHGGGAVVFRGGLGDAWQRLALHLRMDLPANG